MSWVGDRFSVLIVDDDHWTTRAIAHELSADPAIHTLETVHSGAEAVEAYTLHRPDVVLMDLNMPPGISGVEATTRILHTDPDARIVILTTAAPGPGIARALNAGALGAVNKTASPEALQETVRIAARDGSPVLLRQLSKDICLSGESLPEAPIAAPTLTPSEYEVLLLVCQGCSYDEIARLRNVTPWTAKSHVKKLREKLAAENLAQLVLRALQFRFICA